MNATARDPQGAATDETIVYEGQASRTSDEARTPTGRFTYGSGSRPLEGYTIKRAIGRGGFGEVYYALTDAGKEVALKLITRNLDVERRGVMQCMNLKSPHLITIHDLRDNDEGDSFVIMEYVAGPSLQSVLERHPGGLPMDEVRHWLRGLVQGVAYLHDHGIVHRDLKPANLFLEEGVVKIGDYGLSKAITHSREPGHSQSVGTCHYMAPEIGTGKYHKPIDIYAIGVILYELITGRVPFDGESVQEVLMKHLTARPDLSPLPEPYRLIVGKALAKDPNHRQQRAVDLLPPGEAPPAADVRFIPENQATAAGGAAAAAPPPPASEPAREDVLHIGPEEPVFYIGPDTMPPRPARRYRLARAVRQIWTGRPCAARRGGTPPAPPRPPEPPVRPAVHRPAPRTPSPPPRREAAPEPPPESPERPTPRARVAELATSMLTATPLAALATVLTVPFAWGNAPRTADPTQLALTFGMILLGTWGVLLPSKLWEGRSIPAGTKRLTYLMIGAVVGLLGAGMVEWAHVGLPPYRFDGPSEEVLRELRPRMDQAALLAATLASYFALSFAANRPWRLAERDRPKRFRVWSVLATILLASLVGAFVPSPQPWGLVVFGAIAAVAQLASPWNREAAAYARYAELTGRRKRA
jgi:hypothetical protein